MTIRVVNIRPTILLSGTACDANDWHDQPVVGTTQEWDWLFAELGDKYIASIKLIRCLNPGIGLRDAKEAMDTMALHRKQARLANTNPQG